jgi:hypothetical protein
MILRVRPGSPVPPCEQLRNQVATMVASARWPRDPAAGADAGGDVAEPGRNGQSKVLPGQAAPG